MRKKVSFAHLSNTERKAIDELKREMLSHFRDKIELLELFGSKVRGEAEAGSDIDLLMVGQRDDVKLRRGIYDIILNIDIKYNVYLSLKLFSPKEFQRLRDLKTPFMQNLSREGIILWKETAST